MMKINRPCSQANHASTGVLSLGKFINHRRPIPFLVGLVCVFLLTLILLAQMTSHANALPEYSVQTGEPCATCHISPSGGGPRGPRGQAWVGEGKPGSVPNLIEALASLGVNLDVDETYYQATSETIEPASPLQFNPAEAKKLLDWLKDYEGN